MTQLLCFGPGIGLGAYYVQTQRISWEAFWGTLPFGIMLFSMITINEIPDYFEDRKGGKANLVARFGREKGVWLFIVSLLSAYAAIVAGVVQERFLYSGLISLLTLPDRLQNDVHPKSVTIRNLPNGPGQPGHDLHPQFHSHIALVRLFYCRVQVEKR